MNRDSRIYVAGHRGLVGSAICRCLQADGYLDLITRTHAELDLTRQSEVEAFFRQEKPEYVFLAAARVGGIMANSTLPADFIYDNLAIQTHIIHAAWQNNVKRLLFLGSSCIYPRECPQPMKEAYLLTGPLEPTNEPYALAKIAGIKMCQSYNRQHATQFLALMPTNLYGPHDNFDLTTSHVLPALIRKFHLAKLAQAGEWEVIQQDEAVYGAIPADFHDCLKALSIQNGHQTPKAADHPLPDPAVILWGTGNPRREFLHVDDLAGACRSIMQMDDGRFSALCAPESTPLVNVGVGYDLSIAEIARKVQTIVGYDGEVAYDPQRPDGTPQKLLDISLVQRFGWQPAISFEAGIRSTYTWYRTNSRATGTASP